MPKFHVQRSITIDASPEKVFDTVSDFGTWTSWSPWLCAEPDAKVTVTQDSSSVGSIYAWEGEVVGIGEIEHRHLEPGRLIEEEIRFVKPWKSKSDVKFEIEPADSGATITWHMNGSLPWFMFWMKPMMETFIGMDYERGLRMLKEQIETGRILSQTVVHGTESVGPMHMAGIRRSCQMEEIGPSMENVFCEARDKFNQLGLPMEGSVLSVYLDFNMKTGTFDYIGGFEIPAGTSTASSGLSHWSLPACQAFHVEHTGSYENLGNAWSAANQIVRYRKLKQSKVGAFEIYRNNPETTDPADLKTDIYLPLK